MKITHTARSGMLKQYDHLTKSLHDYLILLKPWGINVGELTAWMDKIHFGLLSAPFVGMIVKSPPPRHLEFDLVADVHNQNASKRADRRQSRAFCKWFTNLSRSELEKKPTHGCRAYRLIQITPTCVVEGVPSMSDSAGSPRVNAGHYVKRSRGEQVESRNKGFTSLWVGIHPELFVGKIIHTATHQWAFSWRLVVRGRARRRARLRPRR